MALVDRPRFDRIRVAVLREAQHWSYSSYTLVFCSSVRAETKFTTRMLRKKGGISDCALLFIHSWLEVADLKPVLRGTREYAHDLHFNFYFRKHIKARSRRSHITTGIMATKAADKTIRIDPTKLRRNANQQQFFRYRDERREQQAWHLLERENLTAEEIVRFCRGGGGGDDDDFADDNDDGIVSLEERDPYQLAYRSRRREIQRLLEALPSGGAWMDHNGRLLPVASNDRGPPLPPLPALNPNHVGGNHNHNNNNNNNNNHAVVVVGAGNFPPPPAPPLLQQQQPPPPQAQQQQHHDALRRDAVAAIARAVDRYRRAGGVNIDADLQLIRLDIRVEPPHNPLTVRRILIAVAAVVLAFVCMLIQTLGKPNSSSAHYYDSSSSSAFHTMTDPLPKVVLKQRDFMDHVLQCQSPTNRTTPSSSTTFSHRWRRLVQYAATGTRSAAAAAAAADTTTTTTVVVDCSDGVLLISSVRNMIRAFSKAQSSREVLAWEPYIVPEAGLNATWWFDCAAADNDDHHDDYSSSSLENSEPPTMDELYHRPPLSPPPPPHPASQQCVLDHPKQQQQQQQCFRGVHDAMITDAEIRAAIRLGQYLIDHHGGDHFDILDDIILLRSRVPTILTKLEYLLRTTYRQEPTTAANAVQPLAFRVYAAGPMAGDGVRASHLASLLNRSNYRHWMEQVARRNKLARHFPVPWPLTVFPPVREACHLLADRQVDNRFRLYTSVLLSDESSDGLTLFVDEMGDVVTRGLAVESTVGRIVLSTTGRENRRCRLPSRSGVRAALQIWWS
jgi:hypothetical protein